jgi:hypothetical protein
MSKPKFIFKQIPEFYVYEGRTYLGGIRHNCDIGWTAWDSDGDYVSRSFRTRTTAARALATLAEAERKGAK